MRTTLDIFIPYQISYSLVQHHFNQIDLQKSLQNENKQFPFGDEKLKSVPKK